MGEADRTHQDEADPSPPVPDERIDEALEETFPASDAPANPSVTAVRPVPLPQDE